MDQVIGYILVVGFSLALSTSFLLHVFGYLYEKHNDYTGEHVKERKNFKLLQGGVRAPSEAAETSCDSCSCGKHK